MEPLRLSISREDARTVLVDPEIFETISEDGMTEWKMPDGPIYLCGYVPELIGCFVLHQQSKVSYEVHVQVLPKHRKEYAADFGHAVIDWAWENTGARKLTAQIPFLYPNVRDFAIAMGFKVEGINRDSHMKNSEIHSQWYLGLSREI